MTTTSGTEARDGEAPGSPPPFDDELVPALEALRGMPSLGPDSLPALREQMRTGLSDDDLRRGGAFEVSEHPVPGPPGAPDVRLLVARPAGLPAGAPCLYHTHGGGMILGDNRMGMEQMLDWAGEFGMVVVSVEYRLAPENPHPAPVEDCWAGLRWTAAEAASIGADPGRIVLAGASAGGGLAAALALMARDRGDVTPLGVVSMYPMLDDRNDSGSARQMAGLGVWDRDANHGGWAALLGAARGGPDVSPYAAPARARDLSGLPPMFLDVGSAETFRDEVVEFASRLWRDGGRAELHVWPGAFHGFDGFAPGAAVSRDAKAARVAWLRRLLAR